MVAHSGVAKVVVVQVPVAVSLECSGICLATAGWLAASVAAAELAAVAVAPGVLWHSWPQRWCTSGGRAGTVQELLVVYRRQAAAGPGSSSKRQQHQVLLLLVLPLLILLNLWHSSSVSSTR